LFAHNRDGLTTSTQSRNLTACRIDRHPALAARARRRRDRIDWNCCTAYVALRCDAPVWSLLEVKRTSGEAAVCFSPTLLTHSGYRRDRLPAVHRRSHASSKREPACAWQLPAQRAGGGCFFMKCREPDLAAVR
jgi:hypothetical protein